MMLYIRNMESSRCITMVENELKKSDFIINPYHWAKWNKRFADL